MNKNILHIIKRILPNIILDFIRYTLSKRYIQKTNLPYIIDTKKPKSISLIYFMGIGDSLFTTSLIKTIKDRWPAIKLYAYVSSSFDTYNSPYVYDILLNNPNIDKVEFYEGKPRVPWYKYNFESIKPEPQTLIIPIKWPYSSKQRSKVLHEILSLQYNEKYQKIFTYPKDIFCTYIDNIISNIIKLSPNKIIFLHLDTRSSHYIYPYGEELILKLIKKGWLVISFTHFHIKNRYFIPININQITIQDTINFINFLKKYTKKVYGICVQSCLWPITASMDIKIIGLNIFYDATLKSYLTENIQLITSYNYINIKNKYICTSMLTNINNTIFFNFFPDDIINILYIEEN